MEINIQTHDNYNRAIAVSEAIHAKDGNDTENQDRLDALEIYYTGRNGLVLGPHVATSPRWPDVIAPHVHNFLRRLGLI